MKLAQTTLSRRDSLKIARRFNAGNGLPCASSPPGARASARFNVHLHETQEMSAPLSVRTLKRRERRAPGQPSLPSSLRFAATSRDSNHFASQSGVKTPGYCRSSLRDKTAGAISIGAQKNLRGLANESQRDSDPKPKVARHELPWVNVVQN